MQIEDPSSMEVVLLLAFDLKHGDNGGNTSHCLRGSIAALEPNFANLHHAQ
jgi:hypothetical protein